MLIFINWETHEVFDEDDRDLWVKDRSLELLHEPDFIEEWADDHGVEMNECWDDDNWEPTEDFEEILEDFADDYAWDEFNDLFEMREF